jgi:hypothetical protein
LRRLLDQLRAHELQYAMRQQKVPLERRLDSGARPSKGKTFIPLTHQSSESRTTKEEAPRFVSVNCGDFSYPLSKKHALFPSSVRSKFSKL